MRSISLLLFFRVILHNWLASLICCTLLYSMSKTRKVTISGSTPRSTTSSIPGACLVFDLGEALILKNHCVKIFKQQSSSLASRSVHLTSIVVDLTICTIDWTPFCRAVWLTWLTFYVDVNWAPLCVHPFIRSTQQKLFATRILKGFCYINNGLACIISSTVPCCLFKSTSAKVFARKLLDSSNWALLVFNLAEGDIHLVWGGWWCFVLNGRAFLFDVYSCAHIKRWIRVFGFLSS